MCGILGYLRFDADGVVDERLLRDMTDSMTHRGPDDAGYWTEGRAALGHRRLSIIDLSPLGRQPMCNEDGSVWIVFNGEIYNFLDLRSDLETRGHRFRSRTDSEVILHGYEEWGKRGCLERLRGMYAFAIWDQKIQEMFVARDRLGIKPLYYWHDASSLIVASEVKAILRHPDVPAAVDRKALIQHLAYRFTLPPRTAFDGVHKLAAGHYLSVRDAEVRVREYWRPAAEPASGFDERSEEQLAELLRERLWNTVGAHLISDVPLGAFLSGGMDSGTLVAIMTDLVDAPVKTYTAGFGGGWHDETSEARRVAGFLHTDHHEFMCDSGSSELLEKIVWHLEEPLINTSVIPLYFVAELASRDVKVALAGEGSDETNGGYRKYGLIDNLVRLRNLRQRVPGAPAALDWLGEHLPSGRLGKRLERLNALTRLRGGGYLALSSPALGGEGNLGFFSPDLAEEAAEILYEAESALLSGYEAVEDRRQRFFLYDIRGWLENELLIRADKMTMAHSLEARVPYLDHELVDFCLTIPPRMKLAGGATKRVLRRAMRDRLPEATTRRPQHGFVVPLAEWFRKELRDFVLDLTHDPRTRARGCFDFERVDSIVRSHLDGTQDWTGPIYGLIVIELWHRTFIDG